MQRHSQAFGRDIAFAFLALVLLLVALAPGAVFGQPQDKPQTVTTCCKGGL
jgi:hypothetical protein